MLVVPDGAGDRPCSGLAGPVTCSGRSVSRPRTPIEAASTPNLDALAAMGRCGLMHPLGPGLAPSSHQAHFALFGYPSREFPGRGLIEALGEGSPPAAGEIVLRANLVRTREKDGILWIEQRPDPREGEASYLRAARLDLEAEGVRMRFVHTGALQGLVFVAAEDGGPLSRYVSDADPLRADAPVLEVQPLEEAPDPKAAVRTARALNAWIHHSRDVLGDEPLNTMLVKWAGEDTRFTPFPLRFGMDGVTLGSGPLYRGLAAAVGLEHHEISHTGDPEAEMAAQVEAALVLLANGYEFVHLHTKYADEAGHQKSPALKAEVLSAIDRSLAPLVRSARSGEIVVAVCPDHQTPSLGPLYHGGGAVPLVIAGGVAGADDVTCWGEAACAQGSLGIINGADVLPLALDAADRSAFLADRVTGHLALGVPRPQDLRPLPAR